MNKDFLHNVPRKTGAEETGLKPVPVSQVKVKKIKPEYIIEKYRKSGIELTAEEAEQILELLYTLTTLTLKDFFSR
ncbi:hypothetical protein IQ37_05715 [Chryseobacterium piperi]|uniref:Uncharacterized protein n=1 Tax=Chryseobacterium piperi TaxID=558152 RepID=A0A086BKQ0_9FLAO|nr:hypothetical protein [Chryseobacterium piperi]ASW72869.1 hypothetical protein CJF12_00215 [Chryseobacterium piperi]KFF29514.1 hypothetical protein IQ37_05715 [Chryseobacterium piperi]